MKFHFATDLPTLKEIWGSRFSTGKIRIANSQTRGGIATFVSGRMEGELHDDYESAIAWLLEVGVAEDRI